MFSSVSFLLLLLPSVAQQSADELVGSVDREKAIEVSALVKKLDGEVLFDYRAQRPLVLASNTKLFTTAAAALELGVDYRWHTKSYRDGNDLVIVGGGDPSMLTLDGTDYAQAFMVELLQSLRAQNLSTIDKLYINGSAFSEQRHSLWPLEHKWDVFCAPPTALCVNASSISVNFNGKNITYYPNVESSMKIAHYGKPGKYLSAWWANDGETLWVREPLKKADTASYAVADGLQFFGWWIHDSLQDSGISVKQVVLGKPPELFEYNLILDYESALSLERVLDEINKESNNLMAEMVLKTLANEAKLDGSYSNGVSEVERILKPLVDGIENLEQLDGSGMARSNMVNNSASPELVCDLLSSMAFAEVGVDWFDTLAVGGVDGTLKSRFMDSAFQPQRIHAKTGFIHSSQSEDGFGASSLSGYLLLPDNEIAVFSFIVNFKRKLNKNTNNKRFKSLQQQVFKLIIDKYNNE